MHGPYFNNLARLFYSVAGGIYIPYIYISGVILYYILIKYFKFYISKILFIYALYMYKLSGVKS